MVIGTIGVRFGPPFAGALDATKAALTALADALRQELAPWRIRVGVVEPASIASSAAGKVAADAASAMAAAPAAGRALYAEAFGRMLAVVERREAGGSSPDVAAATVARALTVARPRSVYLCGRFARRLALISWLPVPVGDAARRRVFGLPAPGSRAGTQPG